MYSDSVLYTIGTALNRAHDNNVAVVARRFATSVSGYRRPTTSSCATSRPPTV